MIKHILIIEDEKPNADRLKRLLGMLRPQATILGVLESVKGSVDWLSTHDCPDVIMMDIRLADGLSFNIFKEIELKCPVIFTTAYDEYAVQAFKHFSIDYLLKPVEKEELEAALERCEEIMTAMQSINPVVEQLLNHFKPKEFRSRFFLPYRDGYKTLLSNDIAFFSSEMKITNAFTNHGNIEIVPQSLEELEQQLDPKCFFRANRQYIIHRDAIARVHNYFNGKLKLDLKKNPDREVIISRDKAPVFKLWMDY